MPVISSAFTLDPVTQADGSRWCEEAHQTGNGQTRFRYLAAPGVDCQAVMTGRVASVNASLADAEELANYDRDGSPTLAEMNAAAFAARLRERFRSADKADACRLAWWLLRRISQGDITDAQARNAFGLTANQWTTVKTNQLQPRSDAWTAVIAASGV